MRFMVAICVLYFLTLTACSSDPCDKYNKMVDKCRQSVQSWDDVLKCQHDIAPLEEACTAQKEAQELAKFNEFMQSDAYYNYAYRCVTNIQIDRLFDPDVTLSYDYTLLFMSTSTNQTAVGIAYIYRESMKEYFSRYIDVNKLYFKEKEVRFEAEYEVNGKKLNGVVFNRGYDGDNVIVSMVVNYVEPSDNMYELIAFDDHYAVPHNGKSSTSRKITTSCTRVEQ